MHPAPSIIFFTVLSGIGLGMIFCLGLGLGPEDALFAWVASILGLGLSAVGGAASTAHLGRPDRAWRAFSQWRSSWLSREACLMVACLAAFGLYAAIWTLFGLRLAVLGWLASGLAAATVYATAMIYAQLGTVPRWSATPTPQLFLAFGLVGGMLATETAAQLSGPSGAVGHGWLLVALLGAAGMMVAWTTDAAGAGRRSTGSDMGTATGLGRMGIVRALEAPHTGRNYLLDEMAYRVARRRAYQLRLLGAGLAFGLPTLVLGLSVVLGGLDFGLLMLVVLAAHTAGMLAFRWLFFAEAEHIQALYYGIR
ncbi:MAG: DmsC/YnfH family molybdoenzyme membrane anchor subunit [Pseudomonadota bacterium]